MRLVVELAALTALVVVEVIIESTRGAVVAASVLAWAARRRMS